MNIPTVRLIVPLLCGLLFLAVPCGNAKEPTPKKDAARKYGKDHPRVVELARTKLITGKVLQVDPKTMIFVLHAEGMKYRFVLPKGGAQPKVGEVLDVTYTGPLGGTEPAQATTVKSSKSNTSDNRVAASPTPTPKPNETGVLAEVDKIARRAPKPSPTPTPKNSERATSVKGGKSNSDNRVAASPTPSPTPKKLAPAADPKLGEGL